VDEILRNLTLGFSIALSPFNLLMAAAGVTVGQLIGALPGIGPVSGVALLLPLTFGMHPTSGIIMLAGIYYGSQYGGTITSVLINTPGESASVVTCLDGYQMALRGRAGPALGIAAFGSFIAGTFGVVMLMLMSPTLARWALSFGPPETFALMLLGLTTVTGLTGDNAIKGYISMVLGLMLAMVGFDIISGDPRYAFGVNELLDGFDFLPVAIGLFGMGEVLVGAEQALNLKILQGRYGIRDVLPTAADWVRSRWAIARGTVLGFFVGILPGAGSTIASFFSYTVERKYSKHPEEFGHGAIEGVAGPEAANNAAASGALVPLFSLGLPSSPPTAVLLAGFLIHGIQPGPLLMRERPDVFWGALASMYVGNAMLLVLNLPLVGLFVRILRVPDRYLLPSVVLFCVVGAYSIANSLVDVWVMVVSGLFGFAARRLGFDTAPVVLALVLGPVFETSLRQALILSGGSVTAIVGRPIVAVLLALAAALVLWAAVSAVRRRPATALAGRPPEPTIMSSGGA
jgi:putative tricarboxylic transport membrane protein